MYFCTLKCSVDNRDDILLVCTGCQLRNHAPIFGVNLLRGNDIGENRRVFDDRRGGIITGGLYTKNVN